MNTAYRQLFSPKVLALTPLLLLFIVAVACGGSTPAEPIVVEKEVIKEIEKPVVVEKEVIKEVEVPVVVEKQVVKEVEVIKEVIKEVPVVAPTAAPLAAAKEGVLQVPAASGSPKLGGIANCQAYSAPTFFDVHRGAAANDVLWDSPMYVGLVELDPETDDWMDIRGDLATSWEVTPDGLSYIFHLNKDAIHWDGEPVTAEDVQYSMDRMVTDDEPRPRAGLIKPYYKDTEIIDQHTAKVNTQLVSAAFGGYMGSDYMKIYPKHVYAPAPDGKGLDPNKLENIVGNGPFKLEKYKKDAYGNFRKFDGYWKYDSEGNQRPYLDGIDTYLIIDRGTLEAAVRAKRIDFSCGGTRMELADTVALAKEIEDIDVYFDIPGVFSGFWVNTNQHPWDDVNVRRALNLAIDRKEMIAAVNPIGSELPGVPMQPGSWFGKSEEVVANLPGFRYPKDEDIATAIKLMEGAGYGLDNPYKDTLRFRNVFIYPLQAPVIKAQLAKIGIELELEQMESAAGFAAWERGDASIAVQATSFSVFEPDVIVNTFYMEKGGGVGGRNYPSYMPDPIVKELAAKQSSELDKDKRAAYLQQLDDHLLDNMDSPWIGLQWGGHMRFAWRDIKNFHQAQSGQGELKFEHIWLDRN
jgi:peptide/nickel transport system substrate-binding protein